MSSEATSERIELGGPLAPFLVLLSFPVEGKLINFANTCIFVGGRGPPSLESYSNNKYAAMKRGCEGWSKHNRSFCLRDTRESHSCRIRALRKKTQKCENRKNRVRRGADSVTFELSHHVSPPPHSILAIFAFLRFLAFS